MQKLRINQLARQNKHINKMNLGVYHHDMDMYIHKLNNWSYYRSIYHVL